MTRLEARSRLPRAVVRLSGARPAAVLTLWGLMALVATAGVLRLEIETSTDSVLDRSAEAWGFYQDAQRLFGGDEILSVVFETDKPFDPAGLQEVIRLSRAFEEIPSVRRVDSLFTVPLVRSTLDGDLSIDAALFDGVPVAPSELSDLVERIQADRLAPRALVSDGGRALAVNVVLEKGAESEYTAILSAIREALGDRQAWLSGVPIFRTETDTRTRSELLWFVPLTVVLIGALLFAAFGSAVAVGVPLLSSGLGVWVVLGVMGALGTPLTISTVILPSILLALGCAYTMHLLAAASGGKGATALEEVALPVALSGLTTALGFVAISSVGIETIRHLGAFGALGVLVVLMATLTVAPAALTLFPMARRRTALHHWIRGRVSAALVEIVGRHRAGILVGWGVALLCVAVGITRIQVETDVVVWFSEDDPIRVAYDEIRTRLSGISPMNVIIEAPEGGATSTPEVVAAMAGLTSFLEASPEVGRAISIADPLRQLHGGFIDDASLPIPDRRDEIEQYLLLLESTEYTRDLITGDRRYANIPLRIDNNGSDALLGVASRAEAWWREHGPEGYSARTTGIMYEFARAQDAIAQGQIRGIGFAFLAVGLVLLTIFRWPALALLTLVPNAVPIVMAFGVMGLLSVPLDAGTVAVGCLALGIAVDDSIHLVTGYYEGHAAGEPIDRALRAAFARVLPPMLFTTAALALGFAALGTSSFVLIRHLGMLVAGLMVVCLLADLLLLPALLWSGNRRFSGPDSGLESPRLEKGIGD